MKYRVTIGGATREVEVTTAHDGTARVLLDGAPYDADIQRIPGGYSLRVGEDVRDVLVGGKAEELFLSSGASRALATVEGDRPQGARRRGGQGGSAAKNVRAPMPGRIVKILVAKGDVVKKGQSLIVIEAMKMENELRAQGDGTIAELHVTEGAGVESGATLITFE